MNDLLALALQAAGGLDRWRQVQSLDVRISLTGEWYQRKGYPEGVPNVTMRGDTRQPAVTISSYRRDVRSSRDPPGAGAVCSDGRLGSDHRYSRHEMRLD